jgi:hypothetical protein
MRMGTFQTPEPDYVVEVGWILDAEDGGFHANFGEITTLNVSQGSAFIPYANLTEADVIGWVESTLGEARVETFKAKLQTYIDRQKIPPADLPQNTSLPWVQE